MNPALAQAFNIEMQAAREAWARRDLEATFGRLERAHILGQRSLWPHILTHLWMLRVGWQRQDRREIAGQLLRLVATLPGALIGWVPAGNTGGANVSALKPMPIPPEFEHHFEGEDMRSTIAFRLLALVGLAALIALAV
jgi:hypothetical protein